jgi:hypothetical protein
MKEKRDDFSWLVALLEEQKGAQKVRPRRPYVHEETRPEFQQWKRKKELMWIVILLLFALTTIVPLIFH